MAEAGEKYTFQKYTFWFREGGGQEWKWWGPVNDALRLGRAEIAVCRWQATLRSYQRKWGRSGVCVWEMGCVRVGVCEGWSVSRLGYMRVEVFEVWGV